MTTVQWRDLMLQALTGALGVDLTTVPKILPMGETSDLNNARGTWTLGVSGVGSTGIVLTTAPGPGNDSILFRILLGTGTGAIILTMEKTLDAPIPLQSTELLLLTVHALIEANDMFSGSEDPDITSFEVRVGTDSSNYWAFTLDPTTITRSSLSRTGFVAQSVFQSIALRLSDATLTGAALNLDNIGYIAFVFTGTKSNAAGTSDAQDFFEVSDLLGIVDAGAESRPRATIFIANQASAALTGVFQPFTISRGQGFELRHDGAGDAHLIELSYDGSTVAYTMTRFSQKFFDAMPETIHLRHDGSGTTIPNYHLSVE